MAIGAPLLAGRSGAPRCPAGAKAGAKRFHCQCKNGERRLKQLMNSPSRPFPQEPASARSTTEPIKTHAERLALEEYERAQKRRVELAELRSDLNPPEVRIRTWEKVHGLRMPSDPMHPILDVIAIGTRLTLAQVREEQRTRAALRVARAPSQESGLGGET